MVERYGNESGYYEGLTITRGSPRFSLGNQMSTINPNNHIQVDISVDGLLITVGNAECAFQFQLDPKGQDSVSVYRNGAVRSTRLATDVEFMLLHALVQREAKLAHEDLRKTNGFVAVAPDGQYVRQWQQSTHTGYREQFDRTMHLEHATVYMHGKFDRHARPDFDCTFLPVVISRGVQRVKEHT